MRYVFVSIIVFLLGLGLFLYGGVGYQVWKNFQQQGGSENKVSLQKKAFHASVSPTITTLDDTRGFLGIISQVNENGFVVKNRDGMKVTVVVSDDTKFIGRDKGDFSVGQEIGGSGKIDKKGVITANVIQYSQTIGKPFMK